MTTTRDVSTCVGAQQSVAAPLGCEAPAPECEHARQSSAPTTHSVGDTGRSSSHVAAPMIALQPALQSEEERSSLALPGGRALEVAASAERAELRLRDESGATLEFEVRFEAGGPVVSVRAKSIALEATDHLVARCRTFSVEARERIELRSQGQLIQHAEGDAQLTARNVGICAEPGALRLKANDDVQLLGENVLLNCERPKPLPEWTRRRVRTELSAIPPETEAGEAELIALLSD